MASDGLRSLLRAPAELRVGERTLTVPWAPASVWLDVIDRDPRTCALALAEGAQDIVMGMAFGDVQLAEVERATHTVLEQQTGHKWWVALKLAYTSASPEMLGELTLSNVDPDRVSLGQWCAAVYRVLVRDLDKKQRIKLDFELELPPAGYEEAWDDGNDYAHMLALARKHQQRGAPDGQ